MHIAPQILREEGALAFWKGNTAAVVRVMPYMSLTFLSYEEYKLKLLASGVPKQSATLAAGSAAGVTAVALTYPLDLVRATMAKPGHPYTSMGDALMRIGRERGIGALYSGISATILGVAPYAALKFASYEALKGALGSCFGVRVRATPQNRPPKTFPQVLSHRWVRGRSDGSEARGLSTSRQPEASARATGSSHALPADSLDSPR